MKQSLFPSTIGTQSHFAYFLTIEAVVRKFGKSDDQTRSRCLASETYWPSPRNQPLCNVCPIKAAKPPPTALHCLFRQGGVDASQALFRACPKQVAEPPLISHPTSLVGRCRARSGRAFSPTLCSFSRGFTHIRAKL